MRSSRDLGLDAVRGLAIVSMFVAHFVPVRGPAGIFQLSEYLTAFLFVLLIGVGAELGRGSSYRWRAASARGLSLILLGLLLARLPMQILVVLTALGIMTLIAVWVAELPWWGLLGVAGAALVLSRPMRDWATTWVFEAPADGFTKGLVTLAFGPGSYRLLPYLIPLSLGILTIRYATSTRSRWLFAGAGWVVAAGVLGADRAGVATLDPYAGTYAEVAFSSAFALAVACTVWAVADHLGRALVPLAAMGTAALSIYCLQIVGDWFFFKRGGVTDDTWMFFAVASVLALGYALAWSPIAARTGWRGPLEGPIDALARGRWPRP